MRHTLLALALALLLLETTGGISGAAPASGEPIRIGAISSLTGSFATFGSMERAGYALAVDDINTAGGIHGRPLLIDLQDDTSNANTALTVAEQFIRSGVPLVLGAYSSSITKPLAVYMTRQRLRLSRRSEYRSVRETMVCPVQAARRDQDHRDPRLEQRPGALGGELTRHAGERW